MNFGPFVFIGVFCTMLISWATFVFGPMKQLGGLQNTTTVPDENNYPAYRTGLQKHGMSIYRANNCASCHTMQVRPRNLGPDLARGWGIRYSVAEDYLYDFPVMLGSLRVGPDLANIGGRADEKTILLHLYNPREPRLRAEKSVMPPYPYLFKKQKIVRTASVDALPVDVGAGYEVIPTEEGVALAAFLASQRQNVYVFEAPPPSSGKPVSVHSKTNAPATNTPAK
jgi:cytochrome c oxidase cbb3-type subunit 2